jgi:hypothetical protein
VIGHDDPHDLGSYARSAADLIKRVAIGIVVLVFAFLLMCVGLLHALGGL